ncbi:MAG TPA: UDP-glucose 4-epimerase GalE, partial [Firmicutes bacterium]|nr:UDP-glucose 4-epimerase GalE [Bacillota bacterium]
MRVLVTGGAGYIGSHVVKALIEAGHDTVTYDNLSKGHREAVWGGEFVKGDISDEDLLYRVLTEKGIDLVIHLAADTAVGESMQDPSKYYWNNVVAGLKLLDTMHRAGVRLIVFSSSAAVYGEPETTPITEDSLCLPTNVYGETKLIFERMLASYERAYGFRYISLRYFNAAGADPSGRIGEDHDPETQLIPIVLQAALGIRQYVEIYGTDYPTEDGTCIRDFIHVCDLATAHVLAANALGRGKESRIYNLGSERGHSVREVIRVAEKIVGHAIPVKEGPRRPGDP